MVNKFAYIYNVCSHTSSQDPILNVIIVTPGTQFRASANHVMKTYGGVDV
jgi:hypothetical protein